MFSLSLLACASFSLSLSSVRLFLVSCTVHLFPLPFQSDFMINPFFGLLIWPFFFWISTVRIPGAVLSSPPKEAVSISDCCCFCFTKRPVSSSKRSAIEATDSLTEGIDSVSVS